MSWWNVIDFRSGKVDKKWLPALILVVILVSVLTRFAFETFGWIAAPFVFIPLVIAAVAEVRARRKNENDHEP